MPTSAALLRAAIASLAATANFTIDRIDDAKLAVDEAFAIALSYSDDTSPITCACDVTAAGVTIGLATSSQRSDPPPTNTFTWTVLTTLADEVVAGVDSGTFVLTLVLESEPDA